MEANQNYTDKELFTLIADGEEDAFALFYSRVKTDSSAYAFRILQSPEMVKEVLQEALIRLWMYRDKLSHVEQPRAWFFRIMANECSRYLSKNGFKNMVTGEVEDNDLPESSKPNPTEQQLSYKETKRIIANVVEQLPPKRRTIYLLSREEGLTQQQIADHLGVSRDYVKKSLITALQTIQKKLKEEGVIIPIIIFLLYC